VDEDCRALRAVTKWSGRGKPENDRLERPTTICLVDRGQQTDLDRSTRAVIRSGGHKTRFILAELSNWSAPSPHHSVIPHQIQQQRLVVEAGVLLS